MSNNNKWFNLSVLSLSTLYFIVALIPFEFSERLWGINHLTDFDWDTRVLVLVISLILSLIVTSITPHLNLSKSAVKIIVYALLPLVLLLIFYQARVGAHFLGDGILRTTELDNEKLLFHTEPLSVIINFLIYKLTSSLAGYSSTQAITLGSYIAGITYYYSVIYFVKEITSNSSYQIVAACLMLFSGVTLLFCGYVESYLFLPAAILIFITTSLKSLHSGLSPIFAGIAFVIMILLHFSTFYLAPSLLMLFFYYNRNNNHKDSAIIISSFLIAISGMIIVLQTSETNSVSIGSILIPFVPGKIDYWLLSSSHLLDILNQLLLTIITAIIIFISMLLIRTKLNLKKNMDLLFIALSLPGALLFLILIDPKLGYAIDWDLFSNTTIPILAFIILLLSKVRPQRKDLIVNTSLLCVAFFSFGSYAMVNSSFDKSLARQDQLLSLYDQRARIGYENLGNYFIKENDMNSAIKFWKKSIDKQPHYRSYGNLAQVCILEGKYEEAEKYCMLGLALKPQSEMLLKHYGVILSRTNRLPKGEKYLKRALELMPSDDGLKKNLASNLFDQQKFDEAESMFREIVELDPSNVSFLTILGVTLTKVDKKKEAREVLLQAIDLQQDYHLAYIDLAKLLLDNGEIEEANRILNLYLTRNPNGQAVSIIQQMLTEM